MILNFSVENFKSIRDKVNLSFEPVGSEHLDEYYVSSIGKSKILKMALIFGPNASGKTTILEALAYLRQLVTLPSNNKSIELALEPFALDKNKDSFFSIEFVSDERYLYEIQLNKKFIVKESLYSFSPKKSLIFERTTDKEKELSKIKFGSKAKINRTDKNALVTNTLWNDTVIASSLKTNIKSDNLKPVINWFQEDVIVDPPKLFLPLKTFFPDSEDFIFYSFMQPNLNVANELHELDSIFENVSDDSTGIRFKDRLIDLLKKADLSVSDIEIRKREKTQEINVKNQGSIRNKDIKGYINTDITSLSLINTIFHHSYKENFSLSLNEESNGTRRYYILAGILLKALFDSKSNIKIIAIDELERSLHPDLVEHFILTFLKICKKHNFQLIATTHNRELLMNKELIRKDVIWFTEKKADGSTDLFSLSDFKSSEIRKENSYYNFYKIGKLGSVPNLIDFFDEDDTK